MKPLAPMDWMTDMRTGERLRFQRWSTDPNGEPMAVCRVPHQKRLRYVGVRYVRKIKSTLAVKIKT